MVNPLSPSTRGHRILAAIMITDAVGFSARMSVDEGLTLKIIDRDLSLIAKVCNDYGGNVLKSTGDGLLLYFLSAVEAVSCGLEIQQKLSETANLLEPGQYLDHRIGIHLGDILVTDSDVMGNGVNITARLQTFAQPRGLCISQIIYDVVKARLSLNAEFLGPLQLKNIQEAVPAYQVSLDAPAPSPAEPEDCTGPVASRTNPHLAKAIGALTSHPSHRRIKKLIFAACQQVRENDTATLAQFSLPTLLESLKQQYPTLSDLRQRLDTIVAGLNRQQVYRDVAETILATLDPWYAQPSASPSPLVNPPSLAQRYAAAAHKLQQATESQRMGKLLYCLNHRVWPRDADTLSRIDFTALVEHTHSRFPTLKDLHYHLMRVVKQLNRPGKYTAIAKQMLQILRPIYTTDRPSAEHGPMPPPTAASGESSSDTVLTPLAADPDSNLTQLTEQSPAAPSPPPAPGPPPKDRNNLFDLRQAIVHYTNPLRAKILLYSCLHGPFGFSRQEWASLRRQPLDDLLRQTFSYCRTFTDLSSKLTIIAHCLDNGDENYQVATAIAQIMRAYYPQDGPLAVADRVATASAEADSPAPNPASDPSSMTAPHANAADAPLRGHDSALFPASAS